MNERIRELEKLATPRSYDETGCYIGNRFDPEKFAELIVRECIEISQVGSITEEKIKQHFGVES